MSEAPILSASKIKTLETCSWQYHCNYVLKLPQKGNSGSMRGTLCHLVFELLLKSRHKHHFNNIIRKDSISGSPAIVRLVTKHLEKDGIFNDENYEMVDNMILVGLCNDYFGLGGVIEGPEQEFLIESESPRYKIRGFIDKPIQFPDKGSIKIVDYKSSKAKFKGDELTSNIQAMTYSLASKKKLWPALKDVVVQFLFLRFPKQPLQEVKFTDEQLEGFEYYLEHVYKCVEKFDDKAAKSNYAIDSADKKWLCKAGKTWRCPYLDPMEYYVIVNAEGELGRCSFKDDLKPKEGEKVEKRKYDGCPAHGFKQNTSANAFDF